MNEYLYSMSANPNPRTILRIEEVLHRTGLKRTMLYDLIRKEKFPNQVSLGARAVGWYEEQVEEWITNRSAAENKQGWRKRNLNPEMEARPLGSDQNPEVKDPRIAQRPPDRGCTKEPRSLGTRSTERRDRERASRSNLARHSVTPLIEADELRRLRDENDRLKRLIADLLLNNNMPPFATARQFRNSLNNGVKPK